MKTVMTLKINKIVVLAGLSLSVMACGPRGSESEVQEFGATNARAMSLEEFKQTEAAKVLESPERCAGFATGKMSIGLWAGYTDNEKKWGKARAICTESAGSMLCKEDESVIWEQGGGYGMEIPGIFDLKTMMVDLCESAGRSIGLRKRPNNESYLTQSFSIQQMDALKQTTAFRERITSDGAYVITTKSTNKASKLSLTVESYFSKAGVPLGTRNVQEQSTGQSIEKQTAEFHVLGSL